MFSSVMGSGLHSPLVILVLTIRKKKIKIIKNSTKHSFFKKQNRKRQMQTTGEVISFTVKVKTLDS